MSDPGLPVQAENRAGSAVQAWLARFGLVATSLLVAWLLIEVALRLALPILPPYLQVIIHQVRLTPFSKLPAPAPPLFLSDDTYGVIVRQDLDNDLQPLVPGQAFHVTTINPLVPQSAAGFRVPSVGWKPSWPVDAVVVGDSFSFCFTEYADCWVERLSSQHGLSLVDLGVPATGSISHQRILETFGLPYQPRFVLWQWYGNDFNEDYGLTHAGATDVAAPIYPDDKDLPAWTQWFKRNSALYAIARYILASRQFAQENPVWVDHYQISDGSLSLLYGRPYTYEAHNMNSPKNQAGFDLTRQAILHIRAALAGRGIRLVIVLIPTKEEVYRAWTEPVLGSSWLQPVIAGREQMLDFCRQQNLLCVDVTDELTRRALQKELLYWPLDSHLNPMGNQVVADQVGQALVAQGLAH